MLKYRLNEIRINYLDIQIYLDTSQPIYRFFEKFGFSFNQISKNGYGEGLVHIRAMTLVETGVNGTSWVAPKNLHEDLIKDQPVGQVFNTISNGVRTMAGYASQIPTEDRWAIIAYIKALQFSQDADPAFVTNADQIPVKSLDDMPIENIQGEN